MVQTHTESIDGLFSTMFKMVQLLINNPIKCVAVTSAEVKNEWCSISTPSFCVMAWSGSNLRFYYNKTREVVAQRVYFVKER